MIVINPNGGLGNQLFVYATGLFFSQKNKATLKIDYSALNQNIERESKLEHFIPRQLPKISTFEKKFFDKRVIPFKFLFGKNKPLVISENKDWWISPKYLKQNCSKNLYINGVFPYNDIIKPVLPKMRNEVKLKEEYFNKPFTNYLNLIRQTNSVCIHIRRGDYLNDFYSTIFTQLTVDYYDKAMSIIKDKVDDPVFFIFSDDHVNVKSEFNVENSYFVSADSSLQDYHEFELIRNCKNHIIANSTFSWWAATLSPHKEGINIAPEKWYNLKEPQQQYANLELLDLPGAIKI